MIQRWREKVRDRVTGRDGVEWVEQKKKKEGNIFPLQVIRIYRKE